MAETAEVEQIRECTNVDINNFTNINIKNGTTASCSANLASNALNTANANNAINECIASNSPMNSLSASFQHHPLASQNFNITSDATSNRRNNSAQNLSNILLHQQTSIASTPIVSSSNVAPSRKCEYLKATMRLKKSLVLPDEFFSSDEVTCYCQSCYKVDGDCTTTKKGEPPAEYVIPIGWARFPLKQSINANQIPQLTTDKWHVAFYGTRLDSIRYKDFLVLYLFEAAYKEFCCLLQMDFGQRRIAIQGTTGRQLSDHQHNYRRPKPTSRVLSKHQKHDDP